MLRLAAALVGVSLVAFVLAGSAPVSADENPTTEEIMKKLHGKTGSHKLINKALPADGEPDWEAITKHAKIYADLSALLEKNKPTMGDEKSWKKLAQAYAKDAKALADAAAKKDKNGVKEVFAKLKESCDTCHENHR